MANLPVTGRVNDYTYTLSDGPECKKSDLRNLNFGPITGVQLDGHQTIEIYSNRGGAYMICKYRLGTPPEKITMYPAQCVLTPR